MQRASIVVLMLAGAIGMAAGATAAVTSADTTASVLDEGSVTGTALAATSNWSGRWRLVRRESGGFFDGLVFRLSQKGSRVTGSFPWHFAAEHGFGSPPCFTGHGGTLTGTVKGRKLTGSMVYPRREGHARATASLKAVISRNGREITGGGEMLTGECAGGVFYSFRATRVRTAS